MRICSFALAALAVAGCHWDLNDKGTEPPTSQLYFPAGIAMDPGGQYVYVSNGNADLRFGGGTVQVVDMLAFECTIARFRATHPLGDPNNPGTEYEQDVATQLPAGCGMYDPTAEYWDQWGKNGLCQRDPLDPSIIDCDESAFILQNSTVKIGNFAGSIRLVSNVVDPARPELGIDPQHRRLFVAVRGDPSVTAIDVYLPGATNGYAKSYSDPGVLVCYGPDVAQNLQHRTGFNPATATSPIATSTTPIPCDASYLIQDYACQGLPTCMTGTDTSGKTQLPTEPFSMKVDATTNRLLVSHLATGQVSVVKIDEPSKTALKSESMQFFSPDAEGRHGAFGLAQQHPDDPHSTWYLTSSVNSQMATFRVGDLDLVIPQLQFSIQSTFAQGNDVRDIIFDEGGKRAFITENNPPSVLVMDTRPNADLGGQGNNLVTDVIDVCQTPSHMGARRVVTVAADGSTQTKTKLVVVCFLSNQVMIVDPDRPGVDDTLFSGFSGPNDIAFNFSNADDPTPITQLMPRHAYITNYTESTIAVVDLEPHSPTENRVLARLGMPPGGFNP